MIRKILSVGLLFFVVSLMPALAVDMDPIPAGAEIVLFVNNHSGLPLENLFTAAPIPPMARQKLDEFFSATSFNPLKDISRVQLMVKKGATKREDNAAIVLSGAFNKDKIMEFINGQFGQGIVEEKIGDLTLYKSKDEKGGLCFFDNSKVVLGSLAAVKVFIEARAGTDVSKDYDAMKSLVGDKAYAVLMIGGNEFLQKEMTKGREKRQARMEKMQRPQNPVGKWLETYLSEGVEPHGIFAQLLENRIEAKIFYSRGEAKNNSIQASIEITDPKITIEKMFGELLKVLPELPAPKRIQKEQGKEKSPSPNKW